VRDGSPIEAGSPRHRPRLRVIHIAPAVPLFIIAFLAARPIRDNSFLWHIRAGTLQLDSQSVISADPFSFTRGGESWRTQSWLVELAYGTLERSFTSLAWVNWMVLTVGAVTAGLIALLIYRSVRSPIVVGVGLVLMIWLGGPFLQPRPVLFSFLLLAALVLVLTEPERLGWLVVPIIWIWASVHGSWVIGGAYVVLEWIRSRDQRLFPIGLVALGSTIMTAHGLGTWQIVIDFFQSRDALALMEEWLPPDFGDIVQAPYLILVAAILVAAIGGKITGRDLIVILPFLLFGLTSRRTVYPAAIVLVPWAALAIPAVSIPRSSMHPRIVGVVLIGVLAGAMLPMFASRLGELDSERFPGESEQALIASRNVFHDDGVGGFLIYAEWPDRLVYIDDRAELYGADGLAEFTRVTSGIYTEVFDRYGFDAALTRPEWPLTDRLRADDWEEVYTSEEFVVFYAPTDTVG